MALGQFEYEAKHIEVYYTYVLIKTGAYPPPVPVTKSNILHHTTPI